MNFRKTLALAALLASAGAQAGTDTLLRFANLSPYQATVSFADADTTGHCWHDAGGLDDDRIAEYADYYDRNGVGGVEFKPYLQEFKKAFGLGALTAIPMSDMDAALTLNAAPARSGGAVAVAMFRGESSANLLEGCKLATSSRRFSVTLADAQGRTLSRKVYTLSDPPDSEWTLSRMKSGDADAVDQVILLGSGGRAHPVDIALASATAIITVVSVGSASAEMFAARAFTSEAIAQAGNLATKTVARSMWDYFIDYGTEWVVSSSGRLVATTVERPLTSVAMRLYYTAVVDGLVAYLRPADAGEGTTVSERVELDERPEASSDPAVFDSPALKVMGGLGDNRSICVYETSTLGPFGVPECRLAGINLAIMEDGSLVYAPLPAVGAGD